MVYVYIDFIEVRVAVLSPPYRCIFEASVPVLTSVSPAIALASDVIFYARGKTGPDPCPAYTTQPLSAKKKKKCSCS